MAHIDRSSPAGTILVSVQDTNGESRIIGDSAGYVTPVRVTALRENAPDGAQTAIQMVEQRVYGPVRYVGRSSEPVEDVLRALKEADLQRPQVRGQSRLGALADQVFHRQPAAAGD